jgi:hypothetical protein
MSWAFFNQVRRTHERANQGEGHGLLRTAARRSEQERWIHLRRLGLPPRCNSVIGFRCSATNVAN